MNYPYRYPELYAELARQGKTKQSLAVNLGISAAGLRYKQREGDFSISEMNRAAVFLNAPAEFLFGRCTDPRANQPRAG